MITTACPIALDRYPVVTMAHGGGGRLTQQLIEQMFARALGGEGLETEHDAARVPGAAKLAMTTDGFVVRPVEFPGGDIGKLAVYGTVNDLLMAGARPAHLSLALILEEGLDMQLLWRIVQSIALAARECGVAIVTGDTKVVERGKGDGIYVTTTGVGLIEHNVELHPVQVRHGDQILVSGDLGRHGIAVLAAREGFELMTDIGSDCASLRPLAERLLEELGPELHCMRDCTRGGLAAACHEIARSAGGTSLLDEASLPVHPSVRGACELLGLDAVHIACEGRLVAFVAPDAAKLALACMQSFDPAACIIGRVEAEQESPLMLNNILGLRRIIDLPSGEQLPRIC